MTNTALLDYLDAKTATFQAEARHDAALRPFAQALSRLAAPDIATAAMDPDRPTRRDFARHPVLHRALDNLPPGAPLAAAFARAAGSFDWSILFHGPQAPELLRETMHVAPLAETPPDEARHALHTGVFVLHPGIHYPLHSHVADEVYYCISGQVEIQHGLCGTPFSIRAGQYSITPSDCVHALRTGTEPVILAYVWLGETGAPNWWWRKDDTGTWLREHWQWEANHEWRSHGIETVTPEMVDRASF